MKSTKKALKAQKKIKTLRKKGVSVVKLKVKKVDGENEKYIIKKLDVKPFKKEVKGEVGFQTYKPGKTKNSFVPSAHVKFPLDKVKSLKSKRIKAKKQKDTADKAQKK